MLKDLLKSVFERAKSLILKPGETWDAISTEADTPPELYKKWIMPLAAILPIASFIGLAIIGETRLGFPYRASIGSGLSYAIVSYALMLGAVYVFALVLDALAPYFGAEKNFQRAFRVSAYFPVAFWLAGVFALLPPLSFLMLFGLYSLYLLAVGLPKLMPPAEGKSGGFILAAIFVAVLIYAIISTVASAFLERSHARLATGGAVPAATVERGATETDDLARAAREGDVGDVLSAMLGAGASGPVVDAEALRTVAPPRIAGLSQLLVNVEQVDTPIKLAVLTAEYGDDEQAITLRIVSSPMLSMMTNDFGFGTAPYNRRTDRGYKRLRRDGDEWVIQEWDRRSETGRYAATRGKEFLVEATGSGVTPRDLERAVRAVRERDLAKLPLRSE